MGTGTACRRIGGFDAWIFVAHEMCCVEYEVVVAVVGAKIINVTVVNGAAGGTNGRWYS